MPAFDGYLAGLPRPVHGLLRLCDAWDGFKRHTEKDFVAIADAALDAA